MLEVITERFAGIRKKLSVNSKLREENIKEGIREIKLALLEADVNYKVVKEFIGKVECEAQGEKVLKSISPTEQLLKIVHDKLIEVMGEGEGLNIVKGGSLNVIMLVGLQGSGKTTTISKLAKHLKGGYRVLVSSLDTYRPGAMEQLKLLSEGVGVKYYDIMGKDFGVERICKESVSYGRREGYHVLLLDTAGRLSIDEVKMEELVRIKEVSQAAEILFVSDAMAGQSVVEVVKGFDKELDLSGIILTKFDSDARGGAALSLKHVTGKAIKFLGVGEKAEDLEIFEGKRLAGRILGKGDIISLVEKVGKALEAEEGGELRKREKKLKKNRFDLEELLQQLKHLKKLGSIGGLMKLLPSGLVGGLKTDGIEEKSLLHKEAILLSMTKAERRDAKLLNGSRRLRIARGSGRSIQEVNQLIKQYEAMQKQIKKLKNKGLGGVFR